MTDSIANFNTVALQGRIFDATVSEGQYGEFVGITVITNLVNGDDGVTVFFRNSNGLLKLAKGGYLTRGRQVHITGHISGVSEVYEKDGEFHVRKRPQLTLDTQSVQLTLGYAPKQDAPANKVIRKVVTKPAVDPTPEVGPQEITPDTPAEDVEALF